MPGDLYPLFFVVNSRSGQAGLEEREATIRRMLGGAGRTHEILAAQDPRHLPALASQAAELARRAGGALIAVGGDGTLSTVAHEALAADLPFGALPQGTFNYFAREHGLPLEIEPALEALLTARIEAVQVGLLNGRAFLVNASLGLHPELLEDREAFKRRVGRSRAAALWAGLATLLREHETLRLRLEHDGTARILRTLALFVGNNRLQLERLGIAQAAALERGRLTALALRPAGDITMLKLALRGAFGQLGDAREIVRFPFRRLEVRLGPSRRPRVKVALDGEVTRLHAPLVFEVAPRPLKLLVP